MRRGVATILALSFALVACGGPSFAGTFENEGGTLTLTEDGGWSLELDVAGLHFDLSGTYEVEDDRIAFTEENGETSVGRIVDEDSIEIAGQTYDRA